ncbi:Hypothetical predicted protein [Mytilus galloprovincialis]|uniref:Uncharacterized protein n=1 Tax=Mytilus galloprovincialis TaxID=29158 RepID=A0A8B6HIF3_MYTGA|nr:Hypothetical predicted protein [Mytilus galloprovincialis]
MLAVFKVCAIYFCVNFALGQFDDNENKNKRLLLNDPDVAATKIANLEAAVQTLKGTVSKLVDSLQEVKKIQDQGSTYIQWGKTSCSSMGTETVYSGFTAGQEYTSASSHPDRFGGAANMLCLPNNPKLSNKTAPGDSFLHGTEFEENFLRNDAADEDVPCAFCRSLNTTSSAMFPGRNVCYDGWKLEYEGYIMSGYWGYRASSYICVDLHPDYVSGGKANTNGQLLYVTGYTAGQEHYSSSYSNRFGGAANMLCLSNNPKLSNKTAPGYSFLYGTEFEENFLRSDAVNEDIPCAFCRSL